MIGLNILRLTAATLVLSVIVLVADAIGQEASLENLDNSGNFTLQEDQTLPRSASSTAYHSEIKQVLLGDEFAQKETVTRRRFKDIFDESDFIDEEEQLEDGKFPIWIIKLVRFIASINKAVGGFAQLLEIVLWGLAITLLIFFIVKYRERISAWASDIRNDEPEAELPTTLFGLDIQKDSVSDDVVAEAQVFWQAGDHRQAVATLLRSSLITLLHEYQCRFFSSDTEAECCERIDQQVSQPISSFMRSLVLVWQRIAYAHIKPDDSEFDQLCLRWKEVFS